MVSYFINYVLKNKKGYRIEKQALCYNKEMMLSKYKQLINKMGKQGGPIEEPVVIKNDDGNFVPVNMKGVI